MTLHEFTGLLDGIFAAHGKNAPAERIVAKWFGHCAEIPLRAAGEIAEQMERATKLEPNVGAQFVSLWFIWRANNPDQCSHEVTHLEGCQYCDRGWLYFVHRQRHTIHVAPCGYCRREAPGAMTVTPASERGLDYIEPYANPDGHRWGQGAATYAHVRDLRRQARAAA